MSSIFVAAMLLGQVPLKDAQALPAEIAPCTRYVRVRHGDRGEKDIKALSLACNLTSTSNKIAPPRMVAPGWAAVNAQDYVRVRNGTYDPNDLARWLQAWEELRFDPAYNDLKVVNPKDVRSKVLRKSLHDPKLVLLLKTEAPVVEVDYLLTRMLTTIKDQGGNTTIFGGLYYEFAAIPATEDGLLKQLGVDTGDDLIEFFNRLPGQMRALQDKSHVTGKKRRFDVLATLARVVGAWLVSTRDVEDGEQGGNNDPLASLKRFVVKAVETIFVRFNGLHGFALFDGKGERQDLAPHQVVAAEHYRDRNGARNPEATRLQACISCIECHWTNDAKGWLPMRNDVLTRAKRGIKMTDPLEERLYAASPGEEGSDFWWLIENGRRELSGAVFLTTKIKGLPEGWPIEKGDQKLIVGAAGAYLVQRWHSYMHEPLDVRDALRELLYIEPPAEIGDAIELFNKVVPITQGESLVIADFRIGMERSRFDWSQARAEALGRIR